MRPWNGRVVALALAAALGASCGGAPEPVALRLLDLFDAATIEQTVEVEPVERTEWRFDGEGTIAAPEPPEDEDEAEDFEDRTATVGWAAYHDVDGLEVRDGHLVGTAGELPLLHAARPEELDEGDLLHAVEITMRVSAGTRVGVTFNGARELDEERVLRGIRRAPHAGSVRRARAGRRGPDLHPAGRRAVLLDRRHPALARSSRPTSRGRRSRSSPCGSSRGRSTCGR